MNDVCVEHCAVKRDTSYFDDKPIPFELLPRYPVHEAKDMTKEEKFVSVVVYLAKVIDHLQGVTHGEHIYSPRSSIIFEDVKQQGVLFGAEKGNSPLENRTKHSDQRERSEGMVGGKR
jgi:hypothetical protein